MILVNVLVLQILGVSLKITVFMDVVKDLNKTIFFMWLQFLNFGIEYRLSKMSSHIVFHSIPTPSLKFSRVSLLHKPLCQDALSKYL